MIEALVIVCGISIATLSLWMQRERHHEELKTLINLLATLIGEQKD
jgi:hypothetical protein